MGVNVRAIIEVRPRGSAIHAARQQLSEARSRNAEYRLSFESARSLFSQITPARLDLLEVLRSVGPCSVYALAKEAGRNYSNVHTDICQLETYGLVDRSDEDQVLTPFNRVEIRLHLTGRQAA